MCWKVHSVRWGSGTVEIEAGERLFRAPRAVITLPLPLLQSGAVNFDPKLSTKQKAGMRLEMGAVVRVVLRFRERFWKDIQVGDKRLDNLSFLHSDNRDFPTWWSTMPHALPMLVGWSGGPHGLALTHKTGEEIVDCAGSAVAELLHVSVNEVRKMTTEGHFHNWQKDPFSLGAYSYTCVGGIDAARELARPLQGTLFFAGEATEFNGRQGTVDGAIASGHRAAKEILDGLQT